MNRRGRLKILISALICIFLLYIFRNDLFNFKYFSFSNSDNITTNEVSINRIIDKNLVFYKYLSQPKNNSVCGANLSLLAIVPISASNFQNRIVIRNTWASRSSSQNQMQVVFLIGLSNDFSVNKKILLENNVHNDIVQGNFLDTYKNLTIKTILGMKWASTYCSKSKFVLKIDDDIVLNKFKLLNYLNTFVRNSKSPQQLKNTMLCLVLLHQPVIRYKYSKFFIPKSMFSNNFYPNYCLGGAYLFTTDLAEKFYLESFNKPYFIFEDVYLGLLAQKFNVKFIDLSQFYGGYKFWGYKNIPNVSPKEFGRLFFIFLKERANIGSVWEAAANITTQ